MFAQFLDNLWQLFIFPKKAIHSRPTENVQYLTLDLPKVSFCEPSKRRPQLTKV